MDLFNEIDDLADLFLSEKNTKLDSVVEGYEDLQKRYSNLHEDYAKEIENSKKVEKSLVKCLKFYSKLCKKYEAQQKIISNLEQTIKEKIICLEEAQRNEEKLKGVLEVYRTERAIYGGQTNDDLRKDKEILLDICCRLIGESVRNNNIRDIAKVILRKFRKDLDDEKITLLKKRNVKLKSESDSEGFGDVKSDLSLKKEMDFKTEEADLEESGEACLRKGEEEATNGPLDLSVCRLVEAEEPSEQRECSADDCAAVAEMSDEESLPEENGISLPLLEDPLEGAEEDAGAGEAVSIEPGAELGREGHPKEERAPSEGSEQTTALSFPPSAITAKSIFDISDASSKASDPRAERTADDSGSLHWQLRFGCSLGEEKSDELSGKGGDLPPLDSKNSEEEKDSEELLKILREMTSVRLPSPVREISDASQREAPVVRSEPSQKRKLPPEESSCRSKKPRAEGEGTGGGLLDSIMSAMSLQSMEFRGTGAEAEGSGEGGGREEGCSGGGAGGRTYSRRGRGVEGGAGGGRRQSPRGGRGGEGAGERGVLEEIRSFVGSPMGCKEEADKSVKRCLSVLSSKPEELIAKCIVATVLENVDEVVETFERPAPPLTKTQHRLIVLLSVFRTLHPTADSISSSILEMLSGKLFPDNFFWPDDSVEAAARFYAALCRARNDPKTLWRFCLHAMTDMRQRCPLLVFTVLKTWPDVLHDAPTLKNNTLALTIVNIFLHMPKTEGLRNANQGRKLVALKHLLMNFYQFRVEETMEGFARKVWEGVRRGEAGAEKAVVLLCRCRDAAWAVKHVVPAARATLGEWWEGKVEEAVGGRVLWVAKQVGGVLLQEGADRAKVKELVHCLSEILRSGKKSHASEVSIIEVLLQLKEYPEARQMIREWIPKSAIEEGLRNEIINASAENILRELKLNRRREGRGLPVKKKPRQQAKKWKGRKKGGRRKKSGESVGASS